MFSQQAFERRKANKGTTWDNLEPPFLTIYTFWLSICRGVCKDYSPEPYHPLLASQNRVTHFGHGQKSQFQVRAMEEILPRLQASVFLLTGGFDYVYQVIKNMSTPEIFTCHSTFTSYQFSFYKEERYNHRLYDYHIGFWILERRTTRVASACCSPASCCSSFISCSRSKLQFQRVALHKENLWQGPFMVQIAFQPHWHLCIMASMAAKPDQNYGNLINLVL